MDEYAVYDGADFGDERLSARFVKLLGQLGSDPGASISGACKDPYQAKAVYRFVGNDSVTKDALLGTVRAATLANISETKPSVLLVLQDTTEINFCGLRATRGLGTIGSSKTSRGILVHSAVAVGEDGEVFGLLAQKLWVRPPEEFGQSDAARKQQPIEGKESSKWLEAMEEVGASFPEGTEVVHVCDREGDFYELFCKAIRETARYVCRRYQNRGIGDGVTLDGFLSAQPAAGRMTVRVPRDSHTGRKARNAEVEVKYGRCRISKPSGLAGNAELPKSVDVYVISAVETNPPDGESGISWQLITNVPTESFDDAVTRIGWYTQRWKIELVHRTLKSGCKVERLQSESADRLMKLIVIYSVIAMHIMLVGYWARTHSDASCEAWLAEDEWKILYRVANKKKATPDKPPTMLEAVVMVAKLGGFLARNSDGFPGVTVLWRGLTKLYTILDAVPFLA